MINENKLRTIPLRGWDNYCFGCSPNNPSGLQMKFYTDDEQVFSRFRVPDHLCGWNHLVHGGIISTILDETMGRAPIHILKRISLTKSMTVDFLQPVFIRDILECTARILQVKKDREAVVGAHITNERKEICAKSVGKFSLFTPEEVRSLQIMSDEYLEEFTAYMKSGRE